MVKLSKSSKMKVNGKQVMSFDLQARDTCPGSRNKDGSIVEVCKNCYATKGAFQWPVVKEVRTHNREDYHRDGWGADMVDKIGASEMFRWFSGGDCESVELAEKIFKVIKDTPRTKHWFVTRSDKLPKINKVLQRIAKLPNVAFRPSADNIGFKKERKGVVSYVIREGDIPEANRRGVTICPVTAPGSTQKSCDTCTLCYTDKPVAYLLH